MLKRIPHLRGRQLLACRHRCRLGANSLSFDVADGASLRCAAAQPRGPSLLDESELGRLAAAQGHGTGIVARDEDIQAALDAAHEKVANLNGRRESPLRV
jgi:hypothetical protein